MRESLLPSVPLSSVPRFSIGQRVRWIDNDYGDYGDYGDRARGGTGTVGRPRGVSRLGTISRVFSVRSGRGWRYLITHTWDEFASVHDEGDIWRVLDGMMPPGVG